MLSQVSPACGWVGDGGTLAPASALRPRGRGAEGSVRGEPADSRPPACGWGRCSRHGRRPHHPAQPRRSRRLLRGTSGTPARAKALRREDVTPDDLLRPHLPAPAGPGLRRRGDVRASGPGLRICRDTCRRAACARDTCLSPLLGRQCPHGLAAGRERQEGS